MNAVVGVVGGSGGVGASQFAAVLAAVAAPCLLVDLDVAGGGLDVGLGLESVPGVRWSGLRVGGGRLEPGDLHSRVPQWGAVSVLAADCAELDADAVRQVLDAARQAGPVIVDLPRAGGGERGAALEQCDLVVVLARGDVAGLVAAHAVAGALGDVSAGLVVRRGAVPTGDAARLVGRPLLGELPPLVGPGEQLVPGRLPRPASRLAAGVLHGLGGRRVAPLAGVA